LRFQGLGSYDATTLRFPVMAEYIIVKKPFDALNLIKEEALQGKFSKELFKKFTSCLAK
jgi:hypothetical protein